MVQPRRRVKPPGELNRRGSQLRRKLSEAVKYARNADKGRGYLPYSEKRLVGELPFGRMLVGTMERRLEQARGRRKILVLEKGAGFGNIIAHIKRMAPSQIETTALSATASYSAENAPHIDNKKVKIGILARHRMPYDIIFDGFGEDYHLPKELVKYSIEKTISLLRRGGEAFTIVPLVFRTDTTALVAGEGRELVEELKARSDIVVETDETRKRFERTEYIDLVIHITKK